MANKLSKEDFEKWFASMHGVYWRKQLINYCEAYANQQREEERKKNLTECIRLRKSLKGVGGETELLATAIVNQIMRYIKLSFNTNKDD